MIFQTKGTEARCKQCGDLLFIFNRDIEFGEIMDPSSASGGQSPWKTREKFICRVCKTPINGKNDVIFTKGTI